MVSTPFPHLHPAHLTHHHAPPNTLTTTYLTKTSFSKLVSDTNSKQPCEWWLYWFCLPLSNPTPLNSSSMYVNRTLEEERETYCSYVFKLHLSPSCLSFVTKPIFLNTKHPQIENQEKENLPTYFGIIILNVYR